jgi:hypothetical protein
MKLEAGKIPQHVRLYGSEIKIIINYYYVQYITYSVNTVQYITVVHYFCYSTDIITVQYYVNTVQYVLFTVKCK